MIVALPAGIIWAALDVPGRAELYHQMKPLRQANEPLTYSELYASRPQLDDSDNSALALLAAWSRLWDAFDPPENHQLFNPPATHSSLPPLPCWNDPWPVELFLRLNQFLAEQTDLIADLEIIRHLPNGRLPRIPQGPHDENVRQRRSHILVASSFASKLLALAAVYDAATGEPDRALMNCQTILNMATPLHGDRQNGWMEKSIVALSVRTLERVLSYSGDADREQLQLLQVLLHNAEQRGSLRNQLIHDRVGIIESHESVRKTGPPEIRAMTSDRGCIHEPMWNPRIHFLLAGAIRSSEARGISMLGRAIAASDHSWEVITIAAEIASEVKAIPYDSDWAAYVARCLLWELDMLPSRLKLLTRSIADLRCARVALAIELYRLDQRSWPTGFQDLVPLYLDAEPIDAFTGELLHYQIDDEKITVYSVGVDTIDDYGDIETAPESYRNAPDVGFRLLNPELRAFRIEESETPSKKQSDTSSSDNVNTPDPPQRS